MTARITLTRYCLGGHPGTHSECPGKAERPRLGILAGINYIHHPQPEPGESLTHITVSCGCPCHRGRDIQPPPQPPQTTG